VSDAIVHGRLLLVEVPKQEPFPLIVITIECDVCGTSTLAMAAHHAKAIGRVLSDCIEQLPDIETESTEIPMTRPKRPEDN
jgi:hypothetical protein